MAKNVFRGSLRNTIIKLDTSVFVKKRYLVINCIESDIEEDIDRKKFFNFENIPNPIDFQETSPR